MKSEFEELQKEQAKFSKQLKECKWWQLARKKVLKNILYHITFQMKYVSTNPPKPLSNHGTKTTNCI